MKTIAQLKKEIEDLENKELKFQKLVYLEQLKTKLQTLQNVCEEIEKIIKGNKKDSEDKLLGSEIGFDINEQLRVLLKKFQGDENEKN